jgi:putative FmdB family regulatory protein
MAMLFNERTEMPIYEYQCKKCGAVFEFLTGIENEEHVFCKNCSSLEIERLISAPSILSNTKQKVSSRTCCGSAERCEMPPCSAGGTCQRD